MDTPLLRRFGYVWIACVLIVSAAPRVSADEIWVTPTSQADIGGLGVASNVFWPVTPAGVVRLAWSIPGNLQTFQSAKVAIIPGAPAGGPPALHFYVCAAESGDVVTADCAGPFVQVFTSATNQLVEVEIGGVLSQHVGTAGSTYLAAFAYTTPAIATDHIVGLRFSYSPATPAGVATLGPNTFTGTQTAPAFVGDGAGLTNLPIPNGAATLGANVFGGTQTAPAFVGDGSALTGLPFPAGAARLSGGNVFTGTQSIASGNLSLDNSTATTGVLRLGGSRFLHNFGVFNAFVGTNAGNTTMTGGGNTGIGNSAIALNTTGANNTAVGGAALISNTTGGGNTSIGESALFTNAVGSNNVAAGFFALNANSSGSDNTAAGTFALDTNSTGSGNVAVGRNAGIFATTGSNNIYLGANVNGVAAESNTMYLGRVGTQTTTFMAGVRGITTLNPDAIPVVIDSAGQLGTISSSIRFKEDIHDMADWSHRLFDLRPVTFRYTQSYANGSKPVQVGLVAEEVAEVFPELAVRDRHGNVETVHYETLNVLLLNELKKEHDEVQRQRERIEILEQRLDDLVRGRESRAFR
jgi:hypothetical protein